ncbi:MAG: NUDIX hydrolase [Actinomycetota bacterium]
MNSNEVVRAAGGVVVSGPDDGRLVLVVHRPKYDDWSFPKGKLDEGETEQQCALREVREETGLSCSILRELSSTQYLDPQGAPKTVRYWLMSPVSGSFEPNSEVDRAIWVDLGRARKLLSYPHDVALVDEVCGESV